MYEISNAFLITLLSIALFFFGFTIDFFDGPRVVARVFYRLGSVAFGVAIGFVQGWQWYSSILLGVLFAGVREWLFWERR